MKKLLFATAILLLLVPRLAVSQTISCTTPTGGVFYTDGSQACVQTAVNNAVDGNVIDIPVGTFDWTQRVTVTKGVTIQGHSNLTGAGTHTPTDDDATTLIDDTPFNNTSSGFFFVTLNPSQQFRLTSMTFVNGTVRRNPNQANPNGIVQLVSTGSTPNETMRVDHIHFNNVNDRMIRVGGYCFGVADHNWMVAFGNSQCLFANNHKPDPNRVNFGDAAFNDYAYFGSDQFFFFEDNTVVGNGVITTSGSPDGEFGGKAVYRHGDWTNAVPQWHGTEGHNRGGRAFEIYDNSFHWYIAAAAGSQRSGNVLMHDNNYDGIQEDSFMHIVLFREQGASGAHGGAWGQADGTSPWDMNDTEGNGHWVQGHPPFLYFQGNATADSIIVGAQQAVLYASPSPTWTTNQWVGFSVRNTDPSAPPYEKGSYIISNTASNIVYNYYGQGDRGPNLLWTADSQFQIHKILVCLDQPGRGKGDLVLRNPLRNSTTGTANWVHAIPEPSFSWNLVYTPTNAVINIISADPSVKIGGPTDAFPGKDVYNLGIGLPADTTPRQVSAALTAATNGVQYTGTYQYPHPFARGGGGAP